MKNSLSIWAIILCLSFQVNAQKQKVFSSEEFEKSVMPMSKIAGKYTLISNFSDNVEKEAVLEELRFRDELRKFARANGNDLQKHPSNVSYMVMLFMQQNGEIEYVWYRNPIVNKPDSVANKLVHQLLTDFIPTFKFKSLAIRQFIVSSTITLGNEFLNKRASKLYISSIELAQKCDKPDTVTKLIFNQLQLEQVPDVIYRFKNLKELDLSKNLLESIPSKVTTLPKLKILQLNHNYLTDTSIHFSHNKHIEAINLQSNRLSKIPNEIKKNKRLNSLWIGNNNLENIDNQSFRGLKRLQAINLYSANIKTLPTGVKKLKSLVELDLYHNKLQRLPDEVCKLKNLKTLAISHNDIGELPAKLSNLKYLKTLYTHHNRLFDLPQMPDLKLLDIKDNSFNRFPKNVYALNNLQDFDCSNNDLSEVPIGLSKIKTLKTCYLKTGNDFKNKQQEFEVFVEELEKNNVEVR
jgi:Leucine-rich repeat (LRR) protein